MLGAWKIGYFWREAWANTRRHLWPTVAAVSSIAGVLFMAGLAAWGWKSVEQLASGWKEKARLVVYLRGDAAGDQQEAIASSLSSLNEVQDVHFVSKAEALARMEASLDGQKDLLDGLAQNPLPASYEVTLKPEARQVTVLDRIAQRVGQLPGVEQVDYGRPWLVKLDAISTATRTAGAGGVLVVTAVVLIILANTARLSLYARLEELEILKLVGATPWVLRGPYLVEGALTGLVGGGLAAFILVAAHAAVGARYGADVQALVGLWPSLRLALTVGGWLVVLGATLGCIAGASAARQVERYLP